jgi:hypothetical protein
MAYNSRNKLLKIISIQNLVLEHQKHGVTQKWVYDNIVYPTHLIAYGTFNRYLSYPAKRELKNLDSGNGNRAKRSADDS